MNDATAVPERGRRLVAGWLAGYRFDDFRRDLIAGLTVGVLLVPQSMAYAQLAGAPAMLGLYASVIPLCIYAALGSSLHVAVGVVAADMLIVYSGLSGMADPGSARWVELVVLLTLTTGMIQLLMAAGRLGFLVNLLSRPVIVGFATGAAVQIALTALGTLLAIDLHGASTLPTIGRALTVAVPTLTPWPVLLGAAAICTMIALRTWVRIVPGPLVVVIAGTVVTALLDPEGRFIQRVGAIPAGLPPVRLPSVGWSDIPALLPTAITLALVQFTALITLGRLFASRFGYAVSGNRELVAVGGANLTGALFGTLPISASFSRSALNVDSGARTPMSNVVASGVVVAALLFLTGWLALVPQPVLAAIIVVAALSLVDLEEIRFLRRAKARDGWVAVVTLIATLVTGIVFGIIIGVSMSLLALLYRMSRPHTAVLGHLTGTRSFRDVRFNPGARRIEGLLLLRIDASFSFINAEFLKDLILSRTADGQGIRAVVLDASSINDLDVTAAEVLGFVKDTLDRRGIVLALAGAKEAVMQTLRGSGLYERLGADAFYPSPHRAVRALLARWGVEDEYLKHVPGLDEPS